MCIRDSCYREKAKELEDDDGLKGDDRKEAEHNNQAARLWLCLLYTSDAADERSSVDLGGRRIIKKKTSNETDSYRKN